ncbi:MAG: type II toxin-antitoxin system prevent-host-death family antitoxin [Microthrixaceae bacterium]
MNVGVRDLKTNLSAYLKQAIAGQDIVVTDHGRPIVRLSAYVADNGIDRGIAEGWIEAPRRSRLPPASPARSDRSSLDVLAEDRG